MGSENEIGRRNFIRKTCNGLGFFVLGGTAGKILSNSLDQELVWQIDPAKCVHCEKCATSCVLAQSAARCMQEYSMCGYCKLCSGFFQLSAPVLNEGAENQICPVGAIKRQFIEDPYFEYTVDRKLCIGCARCVKTCTAYGNGSFYLQIQRDICLDCNECSIAKACESNAIRRIPGREQYSPKKETEPGKDA